MHNSDSSSESRPLHVVEELLIALEQGVGKLSGLVFASGCTAISLGLMIHWVIELLFRSLFRFFGSIARCVTSDHTSSILCPPSPSQAFVEVETGEPTTPLSYSPPSLRRLNAFRYNWESTSPYQEDLTEEGVEPHPGPPKHSAEEIKKVMAALRSTKSKIPHAPKMKTEVVSFTNAPPIQRKSAPQNKSRKQTYLNGDSWNPRADMSGYFQTLCDAEQFPPVRLGGETMIPTALTTLHQVFQFSNFLNAGASFVIIPRLWNPIMCSGTQSSPYTYATPSNMVSSTFSVSPDGFNSSSVTTLQSLAAAARVVSMKVKIYCTSSATNDAGAVILGLCPKDPGFFNFTTGDTYSSISIPNSASASVVANLNQTSASGYPVTTTLISTADRVTTCTQGFNEFNSEDWTDTVPLKGGASVFWLPEDPSSLIFSGDRLRQSVMVQVNSSGAPTGASVNASPLLDPFFCFGLTGLNTNSSFNVEVFFNLEYTVTAGASNVIETKPGAMNSIEQFSVAKRVGGNLDNLVVPSPEGSLWDKFKSGIWSVGKSLAKGSAHAANAFLFGSSDIGKQAIDALF